MDSIPQDVGLTRSRVKTLIRSGAMRSAKFDRKIHQKYRPEKNEVILISLDEYLVPQIISEDIPLQIIFEDEHLLVIDKEPGLVVHPGAGVYRGTLANALVKHYPKLADIGSYDRPGIVHRLDKDTSGLLVVAKSEQSYLELTRQLFQRSVKRQYLSILWGVPNPSSNTSRNRDLLSLEKDGVLRIGGKIGRNPKNRKKMVVRKDGGGKEAVTRCRILKSFFYEGKVLASLVSCWLETGRTHQIRVHMDAINHGIVGDPLYRSGRKFNLNLSKILGPNYDNFCRQALHAEVLAFRHPINMAPLNFKASPPQDFQKLLESFEQL